MKIEKIPAAKENLTYIWYEKDKGLKKFKRKNNHRRRKIWGKLKGRNEDRKLKVD